MKSLTVFSVLVALAGLICLSQAAPGQAGNKQVDLKWDHPTNQFEPLLKFRFYTATNITTPLTNWVFLTSVSASDALWVTNGAPRLANGTNYLYKIGITVTNLGSSDVFVGITAANFSGESSFSDALLFKVTPTEGHNLEASRPDEPGEVLTNRIQLPPIPGQ